MDPDNFADNVMDLCCQVVCCAYSLDRKEGLPPVDEVSQEMVDMTERVRGNRPACSIMCWQDVRLVFLAALDRARDIVEGSLTDD